MPTGDRGGATTKRLTPRQKAALRRTLAQLRATPATSEHSNGQSKPAPRTLRQQMLDSKKALDRKGGHDKTSGTGAATSIGKTAWALAGPLARDIKNTPNSIVQNSKVVVTGDEKYKPKPMESGVFYPKLVEEFGKSVVKDVTDPRHHKLNLALDVASVVSGGAAGVGKLVKAERAVKAGEGAKGVKAALKARALPQELLPRKLVGDKATGTRKITLPEGGSVQPRHQSPSIPTAAAQHAADRISEKIPGAPVIGSRARVRRIVPEQQAIRDRRAAAELGDLQHAAHKIKGRLGTSPKEAAYSAVQKFGHGPEGVKLLDADIVKREKRLASLPAEIAAERAKLAGLSGDAAKAKRKHIAHLENEVKTQAKRVAAWKSAREFVHEPSQHEDLHRALVLGEAASKNASASRVARGKITADTAEQSINRNSRVVKGAKFVKPTPGRLGKESYTLKRARGRVVSLQRRFDAAPKGPRADRLGSALSVAKDELQAAEKAAANRVTPTGLVGAADVKAGPGAFYAPDVEKRGRRGVRTKSINRPKDKAHQSTGTLFEKGRDRLGPDVTVEDALKETRYRSQAEDAKLAESFSVPFDETTFDAKKHVLMNPKGAKVDRYLTAEDTPLELAASTPREIAEHWFTNRMAWAQDVFPSSVNAVPAEHRLGLRMIDKKLAEAITGRDRYVAAANNNALLKLLDMSNNVNRLALIYLNPSYVPKNFAGNLGFLALQQGPFMVNNLRRATKTMGDLSPETLRWISSEAGGGAAVALAHESRGALSGGVSRIADVQGAGADRLPRIAAWLWEAERRGYKTAGQIEKLRRDEKLGPVLNEISEATNQAMVKFARAPTQTRRAISRAIFIAPWVEGGTRYVGRLALDRPLAARAAQEVRQRTQAKQKEVFGAGTRIIGSRLPISEPHKKLGANVVRSFNPMSLSSTGQAFEVLDALKNAATGNWKGSARIASFAQPSVTAVGEALSGIDTYHGRFYKQGTGAGEILKENFLGTSDRPSIPLADAAVTARRSPQTEPFTGPAAGQPNYVREGGPKAALWKLALGSARPTVEVNLDAVKAKGEKLNLSDEPPVRRSYATVFKQRNAFYKEMHRLGELQDGKLPQSLRNAFNLKAEREARYAHASEGLRSGTVEYQRARFIADALFLVKHKQVTPAEAHAMQAWAKQEDIEKVKEARSYVSSHYYQDKDTGFLALINESRKYLEEKGAKLPD